MHGGCERRQGASCDALTCAGPVARASNDAVTCVAEGLADTAVRGSTVVLSVSGSDHSELPSSSVTTRCCPSCSVNDFPLSAALTVTVSPVEGATVVGGAGKVVVAEGCTTLAGGEYAVPVVAAVPSVAVEVDVAVVEDVDDVDDVEDTADSVWGLDPHAPPSVKTSATSAMCAMR